MISERSDHKDTNPKDAVGVKKVPMSVVPQPILAELALAMFEGARKYGRHNYRTVGVRASVYYDATMRHLMAYWEGQDIDPGSGRPHIVKAMASLCVLLDATRRGMVTDDRPPREPDPDWLERLNEGAAELIERYPDAVPAHLELDRKAENK